MWIAMSKKMPSSTIIRRTVTKMRALKRWRPITHGGLAERAGKRPRDFSARALYRGAMVEIEHTDNPRLAVEIAMDHLTEDPNYYAKLERVER